jgi:iron(II)-dependent oxidoreductase
VQAVFVLVACGAHAPRTRNPPPDDPRASLVAIPGGSFTMGDPRGEKDEAPTEVAVAPFRIMKVEVTNRQFEAFVAETGYVTDPERSGAGLVWDKRWRPVRGADWRHPRGPGSSIAGMDFHPVVQISVGDADAFCRHPGMRLPSEAEWERAARGFDQRRYPWGDEEPVQGAAARVNFGTERCCAADRSDGYLYTAPVGSYPRGASPFGIMDMAGNVWEWTRDSYLGRAQTAALRGGGWGNNPYCLRVSYRHGNRLGVGRDHIGVRCAADSSSQDRPTAP